MMRMLRQASVGVALSLLAGCGGTASNVAATTNVSATLHDVVPVKPMPDRPALTAPGHTSIIPVTPVPTGVSPPGARAAAAVVQSYYALIEARRYGQAYRLWEPGTVGMSAPAFTASFAKYADYHAEVGAPGQVDAGAGQRYVTIPVRADGTLKTGGSVVLAGAVTLHHVADIDGATPEQRSWRIRSSDLKPGPGSAPGPSQPDRVSAHYRCIDGNRLAADFDNAAGIVTVRRGDRRIGVLQQQRAASGIWYTRGALELRGKGDAMTFSEPGKPPIACTVIR